MSSPGTIVEEASAAATEFIFSEYSRSEGVDLDISVTFDEEELLVDIVLDTDANTDAQRHRERRIADDAAMIAADAVDRQLDRH